MKNDVFITGTSCYFPNKPVSNEDMEEFRIDCRKTFKS